MIGKYLILAYLTFSVESLSFGRTCFVVPQSQRFVDATSTALYLFGGKKDTPKANAPSNNPMGGMMDQLAMFKKAQELAKKKQDLDKELMNMDIVGSSDSEGNVKVTIKYVPAQLPINPSPGYDAVNIDINDDYFNKVSAQELSEALVVAIRDGETQANIAVAQKYKVLEAELGSLMGGMQK
jgi:DNA-binding protein YbaB